MSGSTATAVGISSTDGSSAFTTTGYEVQLTPEDVKTIHDWEGPANAKLGIKTASAFTSSGTSDVLFSNHATGDTWLEVMSNGCL
jgi:hypothetical protein